MIEQISRVAFALASVVLMLMAVALVAYGVADLFAAARRSWHEGGEALLTAVGYVVIAVAVFDVAKYFMEEEVIRGREMRTPSEARRSLTKFIAVIAIAVFVEGVVITFQVGKQDVEKMIYPTALLVTAVLIVLGLGLYQRLSADVESRVGGRDRAARGKRRR
jgi:uncharacterized membrane protein YGL010W